MAEGIIGSLLAQARPANTTAATAYTASIQTEITRIVVANTSGGAATFRIFHDDDGSTYDQTTALYYDIAAAADTTYTIEAAGQGTGLFVAPTGTIGVRTSVNSAFTFSLYGRVRESR